jgi:hypothetical protein
MSGITERLRGTGRKLRSRRAERKATRTARYVKRAEAKAVRRRHTTFDEGSRGPGGGEGSRGPGGGGGG